MCAVWRDAPPRGAHPSLAVRLIPGAVTPPSLRGASAEDHNKVANPLDRGGVETLLWSAMIFVATPADEAGVMEVIVVCVPSSK